MDIEQIKPASIVTTLNGMPGMSSQEIAEITGKRHKNVLRDIQKMVEEIGSDLSQCQIVETQAPDSYGRLQPLTILDKELTFTLLSRYSFKLSRLIVRRWFELEGSGFIRVSVQESMCQLVERERDVFRKAMKDLRRGPQSQTPTAKALRQRKATDARLAAQVRRNVSVEGC